MVERTRRRSDMKNDGWFKPSLHTWIGCGILTVVGFALIRAISHLIVWIYYGGVY